MLLFDIGANNGRFAQANLAKYSKIICVEPNTHLHNSENFRDPKIVLVGQCVGDEVKQVPFYVCPYADGISTCDTNWITESRFTSGFQWNMPVLKPQTTVDEMVKTYGVPSMIKVDVEGYEKQVFLGMSEKYCPVAFEVAEEKREDVLFILNQLATQGFTKCYFLENVDTYDFDYTAQNLISIEEMITLVTNRFVKERRQLWGMIYCQ